MQQTCHGASKDLPRSCQAWWQVHTSRDKCGPNDLLARGEEQSGKEDAVDDNVDDHDVDVLNRTMKAVEDDADMDNDWDAEDGFAVMGNNKDNDDDDNDADSDRINFVKLDNDGAFFAEPVCFFVSSKYLMQFRGLNRVYRKNLSGKKNCPKWNRSSF